MMECYWVNQSGKKYDFMRDCRLLSIDGADIEKEINTSSIAGYDGSSYVSEQTPERSILLLIRLKEAASNERAKFIERLGRTGTLYIDSKKIEGRLKSADYIISETEGQEIQITILCPSPYFTDLEPTTAYMAASLPMWEFPFEIPADNSFEFETVNDGGLISSIENKSSIDVGCVWRIKALTDISKPKIIHLKTYEWFEVDIQLQNGDILEINTKLGNEAIT
ncbi:MAG TPA: phage tail family protein, partial [Oscillospiraceae bacterium]|nr:phage tail family protein [Oscillospiraceae bacterium]